MGQLRLRLYREKKAKKEAERKLRSPPGKRRLAEAKRKKMLRA